MECDKLLPAEARVTFRGGYKKREPSNMRKGELITAIISAIVGEAGGINARPKEIENPKVIAN